MEDQEPRYAVYFVPAADSALYRFGSMVLQYDCYTGAAMLPPEEFIGEAHEWHRATAEPRRYGFHATLKPPFHLSPAATEAQLISALQSFAALGRRVGTIRPAVQALSGFIAVVPAENSLEVNALAADCATIFDAFRAPMSARERARRVAAGLNRSQVANLDRWGYPYLFDDFRFHMTLTGEIAAARRSAMIATLRRIFQRFVGDHSVAVDRLALLKQERGDAPFRVISHVSLGMVR